jgi:hypothetical protein
MFHGFSLIFKKHKKLQHPNHLAWKLADTVHFSQMQIVIYNSSEHKSVQHSEARRQLYVPSALILRS